jgi:predicted transcriptional regulator
MTKDVLLFHDRDPRVVPPERTVRMPRPIHQFPAPSKTDLEILAVLWDRPSATAREVYDALLDAGRLRRRVAYTTLKTYLDRLVRKGYIDGRPSGYGRGTYRYTTVVSRAEVRDHPDLLARLVRVFRLTPAEFTRWCEAHGRLSQEDKAALHTLVQTFPDHHGSPAAAAEP